MENINITADILDYLGKYENGVLVLLSINYNDEYKEGTLYYSDKILTLTVDDSIEKDLGKPIELWEGYRDLIISLLKRVVPYNDVINTLDELDISKYDQKDTKIGEEVDETDIKEI
jgi:hypothetical protein